MASTPFKLKEFAKEKEIAALEKGGQKEVVKDKQEKEKHEKEKREKNESKEKQEKDKSEKEKLEKEQKEQKESKESKDQKDQKDKEQKHEKQEKEKHEKEIKDLKDHKETAKEKETAKDKEGGKIEQKEAEVFDPSPSAPQAGAPEEQTPALKIVETKQVVEKPYKLEKDKFEKHEKYEKFEKHEKHEIFEYKVQKDIPDTAPGQIQPGDPVEQRLTALESAVNQLAHFIPENLRPDLTQGALKQEPEAASKPPASSEEGNS